MRLASLIVMCCFLKECTWWSESLICLVFGCLFRPGVGLAARRLLLTKAEAVMALQSFVYCGTTHKPYPNLFD